MNKIIDSLNGNKDYIKAINQNKKVYITGLTDSAKAYVALATCISENNSSGLIITKTVQSAKKMIYDLEFFMPDYEICYLPSISLNYYDVSSESREIENERINIIKKIQDNKKIIVVTELDSIMSNVLKENVCVKSNYKIKTGEEIKLEKLIDIFTSIGYVRYDRVEGKGTFSVRGDIIDVFPINMDVPCRIEFDFDMVDSIRTFDILSQRSIDSLKEFSICQSEENILSKEKQENAIKKLKSIVSKEEITEKLRSNIEQDIISIEQNNYKNIINKYFKLFQNYEYTMLDYFIDNNFTIFIDEYERLQEKSQGIIYENSEIISHLAKNEYLISDYLNTYIPFEYLYKYNLKDKKIYLLQKLENINKNDNNDNSMLLNINTKEASFYRESLDTLESDIEKRKQDIIIISLSTEMRKNQVKGFLENKNIKYKEIEDISKINSSETCIYLMKGIISSGFESDILEFCLIAEPASGITKKIHRNKKNEKLGIDILSYEDLKVGDIVVHENHGIGKYLGIESVNVQGVIRDYIKIEYASSGMLYVPVTQLDLVKKYDIPDSDKVKLNNLNGKSWENTKSKVKTYVKEIAKDLIKLYAKRQRADGFCFLKDTVWQQEFEDSFEYELTPDQKKAVEEIKQDMESTEIMDRLLCGDVGYGKTEVALRASFKAVMSGKQVAYLVPTTVLCLQQFNTFKERMESFSVRVEMLSRFKTKKEQEKILKDLKDGKIDVIVGTHRLLSKDVEYKNLGFLIIDEEHRFGVTAKEEIKKIKENIDVLSMTATPIPRTLNMSLIGVRKMSNLKEPPIDRLPVHTYVMEYNEEVISEAIKKELLRDGQVFYLSNKVENIEEITSKVRELSGKEARVAYAHGQMDPNSVEDIMLKFVNHEIDVLVCTTILESGIDIPNANLIIVENADKLGLAQLYQIRGRVGRSNRLAYAYITYDANKQITEISEKRLKAIKDFTEFGSGYKIALRDLELRGAGSLLGNLQHGHMISVGYNMYLSLLDKALEDEKQIGNENNNKKLNNENEQNIEINKDIKIELDVSAYISDNYISDAMQKIAMYQKISDIENSEDALDVIDELIDRFGNPPREVENLIKIVEIRNMSRKIGITKICKKGENLIFEPGNLKYTLTNKFSNDILCYVQKKLVYLSKLLNTGE